MNKNLALVLVGLAGILWASSGCAAQEFFSNSAKSPLELTNIRMCTAGFIMLIILVLRGKVKIPVLRLNREPILWLHVVVYGIIGIVMVQFTYFKAIEIGGAAATTVILSATPAMVVIFNAVYNRKLPNRIEVMSVILAIFGVFLLVTGGNTDKLIVPLSCMLWSLSSGAVFSFAMIFPKHLFAKKIDPKFMTSVGMFGGGLLTFTLIDDWDWSPFFYDGAIFPLIWIVIFGTVAAFMIFNIGLRYLTPEEAAITSTSEPASSVVLSYFIFGTAFGLVESVGIVLVLAAILSPVLLKNVVN